MATRCGSHLPLMSHHITALPCPITTVRLKASQPGCRLLFSHPSSAYIKGLSFCLNTPPQIPSLHSDLCTKFLPLSHTAVFSEEKRRLFQKQLPSPFLFFFPSHLLLLEIIYLFTSFTKQRLVSTHQSVRKVLF